MCWKKLHDYLNDCGYNLWTPWRLNMKGAKQHNNPTLKNQRRRIETVFSTLNQNFDIEHNRNHTIMGFQTEIEFEFLLYNSQLL